MSISEKLQRSLHSVSGGDPWYGSATYSILDQVSFEAAYETPPGSVHNIAGIVLHMLGWTFEVIERMQGKEADEPTGGDWPNPGKPDEEKWQRLLEDLKLANVTLAGVIQSFPPERWQTNIKDHRDPALGTGVTYEALIEGLIQHHIYHSGQIALLNRHLS